MCRFPLSATGALTLTCIVGSGVLAPDIAAQATGSELNAIPAAGAAPLVWPECQRGQVRVMILGTFHFDQTDDPDILAPGQQIELEAVLTGLGSWAPERIAVEFPHARQEELSSAYSSYFESETDAIESSKNEIQQLGFRLAKRLGHADLYGVDVRMTLWHDSIQVFDDQWPEARGDLRREWKRRYAEAESQAGEESLIEILLEANRDDPPSNSEMYAGFLPLVQEEVYAGALKLRPWYDRNLRIIQNLFRIADPADDRLLIIIGAGHLRIMKQMLELTPQMCPVSALGVLEELP